MSGNSQRPGSRRKPGTKKGSTAGSGGKGRKALEGKGPTPKAEDRPGHTAYRRVTSKGRPTSGGRRSGAKSGRPSTEVVAGRNPVVEALRERVPASALFVAERIDGLTAQVADLAAVPVMESPRAELDRLTGGSPHQGLALQVPPYDYAHPNDLLARAIDADETALIVALDGVTDPRNLGAVVRSVAAFGAHGVIVPERRSAGMTASAWKTSAGAAARVRT